MAADFGLICCCKWTPFPQFQWFLLGHRNCPHIWVCWEGQEDLWPSPRTIAQLLTSSNLVGPLPVWRLVCLPLSIDNLSNKVTKNFDLKIQTLEQKNRRKSFRFWERSTACCTEELRVRAKVLIKAIWLDEITRFIWKTMLPRFQALSQISQPRGWFDESITFYAKKQKPSQDGELSPKFKKAKLWSCPLCFKYFMCKFNAERQLDKLSKTNFTKKMYSFLFIFLPCKSSDRWSGNQKLVLFWMLMMPISKANGSLY